MTTTTAVSPPSTEPAVGEPAASHPGPVDRARAVTVFDEVVRRLWLPEGCLLSA
jgi:hypothetical protein